MGQRRRLIAPKVVRQVARAAGLNLRGFAEAILDGQPSPPASPAQRALMRWLLESERSRPPEIDDDEVANRATDRLKATVDAGDPTTRAILDDRIEQVGLNLVRVELAVAGARWAPDPPEVPKPQRMDAIATTVLNLTGWRAVADETVQAIYRWLFGDEALFVIGTVLRVAAGQRVLENPERCEVEVPHPDTGEPVVVTRDEIREHGEADLRVMLAERRYVDEQLKVHGRLMRVIAPYGSDMKVEDAIRAAALDHGIDPAGRETEELIPLVLAAAEASGRRPA